jgi:hypothetical protein
MAFAITAIIAIIAERARVLEAELGLAVLDLVERRLRGCRRDLVPEREALHRNSLTFGQGSLFRLDR